MVMTLKERRFSLADVQSDVLSLSGMYVTASIYNWSTASCMMLCEMLTHVSMRHWFKSLHGVADGCLVHAFLHLSLNSAVNWFLYPFCS